MCIRDRPKTETKLKEENRKELWNITRQKQQIETQRKRNNGGTELPENRRYNKLAIIMHQ